MTGFRFTINFRNQTRNQMHWLKDLKSYTHLFDTARQALTQYRQDVESGEYPAKKHQINIKDDQFERFFAAIEG